MAQINCFSFDPFGGVTVGLPVVVGMPTTRNDGSVFPPHVRCGGAFIGLDRNKAPTICAGRVVYAQVRTVHPSDPTRATFETLASEGEDGVLLLASHKSANRRVKSKRSVVDGWAGITADGGVQTLRAGDGNGLFLLTEEDQEVDIFVDNGAVFRLRRENNTIISVPLSHAEMADARVGQLQVQVNQLTTSDEDVRRLHGVLWGTERLLRFTAKDSKVRNVFSDFLTENVEKMTPRLRESIRSILFTVGDLEAASHFIERSAGNVISLDERRAEALGKAESRTKKAEADARRALRRQRDRDEYLAKLGGGNQKKGKQAKGK